MTKQKEFVSQLLLSSDLLVNEVSSQKQGSLFPELSNLLSQVEKHENSLITQPYYAHKKSVLVYKLIFVLLGCVFLALGTIASFKTANWIAHRVLWDTDLIKSLIVFFSITFSFAAFLVSFLTKIEKEVAIFVNQRSKKTLKNKYNRQCLQFKLIDYFPYGDGYQKKNTIRHLYLDSLDAIRHAKEECQLLLKRIAASTTISKDIKEKLFNQALLKFEDFNDEVISSFESNHSQVA